MKKYARSIATLVVYFMAITVFFAARTFASAFGVSWDAVAGAVVALLFIVFAWRRAIRFADRIGAGDE